jgi:C-terminal peptidase prc
MGTGSDHESQNIEISGGPVPIFRTFGPVFTLKGSIFMTKVTLTGFVGSLVLALFVSPGHAEETKSHPCVVLVGISKYADEQILPRPHAEADVKALYDLFRSQDYLGFPAENVRLLLGKKDSSRPSELATQQNILSALRWAATSAGTDDLVIIAFVCQGAPLGERACYFATDSTFKDRAKNAVAAGDIETALEKLKSRRFCGFLDVNFKGFKPGKDKVPEANVVNFYREFLGTPKEDEGFPIGRILFLANYGVKPSIDLEKHGLFTQALLAGLKGAADKEGYEPDGVITVDELVEYMKKEVPALARRYGKTKEEKELRHLVLGGRGAHFELTRNPAVTAKVKERLDRFAKLAADQKLAKDLTDEGIKFLSRMPKLEAHRSLRKEYQQLADGTLTVDKFLKDRDKILADMKLDSADAATFANKVLKGARMIKSEYVKDLNEGDLIASAIKGLYQRIDEKLPSEIRDRLAKVKELKEPELKTLLTDARTHLGKREDLSNHKDIDYALQRMMTPLDPYTTYIDPETVEAFKREMGGKFTGIGIQIRIDSIRDQLLVITPIKGSPAYKAGLKAGDVITQVIREYDDKGNKVETPEVIPTKGLPIQDAVKKIVGPVGTKVKLVVERAGVEKPLEFEIKRGNVEVETVLGVKRNTDDSWDYMIDPDYGICYVRLTQFSTNTVRDMERVLEKLKAADGGIKGFVLDLRFNPGGLLTSAVKISDMFVGDGLIVTIKPRVGSDTRYEGDMEGSLLDFPMVCLVNGHSASGSEIVSACLQDHKRALIIGERSYGKGSVQNIQPFEKGELKMTTASFWRPNGQNLNRSTTKGREDEDWGVIPDKNYVFKLTPKERDELEEHLRKLEVIPNRDAAAKDEKKADFKDTQLDKALQYLRNQIKLAKRADVKKAG